MAEFQRYIPPAALAEHPLYASDSVLAPELARLQFLVKRDGIDAAERWARRTLCIYATALRDPGHHARSRFYRRRYVKSCLVFRRFIRWRRLPQPLRQQIIAAVYGFESAPEGAVTALESATLEISNDR